MVIPYSCFIQRNFPSNINGNEQNLWSYQATPQVKISRACLDKWKYEEVKLDVLPDHALCDMVDYKLEKYLDVVDNKRLEKDQKRRSRHLCVQCAPPDSMNVEESAIDIQDNVDDNKRFEEDQKRIARSQRP